MGSANLLRDQTTREKDMAWVCKYGKSLNVWETQGGPRCIQGWIATKIYRKVECDKDAIAMSDEHVVLVVSSFLEHNAAMSYVQELKQPWIVPHPSLTCHGSHGWWARGGQSADLFWVLFWACMKIDHERFANGNAVFFKTRCISFSKFETRLYEHKIDRQKTGSSEQKHVSWETITFQLRQQNKQVIPPM